MISEKRLPWWHAIALMLIGMSNASCERSSAKPDAVVTMSEGRPCFSVPDSSDTRGGIPLHAITVHERDTPKGFDQSVRWKVDIESPTGSIPISPQTCVRYGTALQGGRLHRHLPLELYTVYSVILDARPDDPHTNIIAYGAFFCLTASDAGELSLHTVSRYGRDPLPRLR